MISRTANFTKKNGKKLSKMGHRFVSVCNTKSKDFVRLVQLYSHRIIGNHDPHESTQKTELSEHVIM